MRSVKAKKRDLNEDDGHRFQFLGFVLAQAEQGSGGHLEEGFLTPKNRLLGGAGNKRHDGDSEFVEGQRQAKSVVLIVLHVNVEVGRIKVGQARESGTIQERQQIPGLAVNSGIIWKEEEYISWLHEKQGKDC